VKEETCCRCRCCYRTPHSGTLDDSSRRPRHLDQSSLLPAQQTISRLRSWQTPLNPNEEPGDERRFARPACHDALERLPTASPAKSLAYVGGRWIAKANRKSFEVSDPASSVPLAWVAALDADETKQAIDAAAVAFPLARAAAAGARQNPAQMVRADARRQGGSGADHDAGTGQAAGGIAGRDRLRRLLHRMVCRGRQAAERRERHQPSAGRRNDRPARALGVVGIVTPWNFPRPW
jgi:aspartate-semialdehyde dehydrogenase